MIRLIRLTLYHLMKVFFFAFEYCCIWFVICWKNILPDPLTSVSGDKILGVLSLWPRQNNVIQRQWNVCVFFILFGYHLLSFHDFFFNASNNLKQCFLFGPMVLFSFLFSNNVLYSKSFRFADMHPHICLSLLSLLVLFQGQLIYSFFLHFFQIPSDSKNLLWLLKP